MIHKVMDLFQVVQLQFDNQSGLQAAVYWVNQDGEEILYRVLQPGERYTQTTLPNQEWRVRPIVETAVIAPPTPGTDLENGSPSPPLSPVDGLSTPTISLDADDPMLIFLRDFLHLESLSVQAALDPTLPANSYRFATTLEINAAVITTSFFTLTFRRVVIEIIIAGVPAEPTLRLRAAAAVTLPDTSLMVTASIIGQMESLSAAFSIDANGEWRRPFGIPGIVIRQIAVEAGLTYAPPWIDNIGFLADMTLGTVNGRVAAKLDINDPDQFALIGYIAELTLLDMMSAITPVTMVAWQAVPAAVREPLNHIVGIKLTDLLINIVPYPTTIGEFALLPGFSVAATLQVWGWQARAFVMIDYQQTGTLTVAAEMDPIDWFGGAFQVRRATKDTPSPIVPMQLAERVPADTGNTWQVTQSPPGEGALLRLQISPDPAVRPEFYISASVSLLGARADLLFVAQNDGLFFDFATQLDDLLTMQLTCVYAANRLLANGRIHFNLNLSLGPFVVDVPLIGDLTIIDEIHIIDLAFAAAADLRLTSGSAPSFALTLSGSLHVNNITLTVPTLSLSTQPQDGVHTLHEQVTDLITGLLVESATDVFQNIFEVATDWAQALADGVIDFSGDVAEVLAKHFGTTAAETAHIMKDILKLSIFVIAPGIGLAYALGDEALTATLSGVGFLADEIGGFFGGIIDAVT